ncbi:MAG: dephospho-CoA kinase [Clostridia bacterium]|nr:dephospho-CoA kinase [Clostridia bacterium]
MMQNKNTLIAITGGIGSGKSFVSDILKSLNYPVVSCDNVCNNLYKKQSVKRKIKKIFPSAVSGKFFLTVDKKEISKHAFSDKEKYDALCTYLTQLTFDKTMKIAKRKKGKVFVEVPLLFEFNKQDLFDKVIVLKRNLEDRIESVKKRSNLSEEEIKKRIATQFDYEKIDSSKYIILENDGALENRKEEILNLIKNI